MPCMRLMAFTVEKIVTAIDSCNFTRGFGPDVFTGESSKAPQLKAKGVADLARGLISSQIPEYWIKSRLLPLLKVKRQGFTQVHDFRPIVCNLT